MAASSKPWAIRACATFCTSSALSKTAMTVCFTSSPPFDEQRMMRRSLLAESPSSSGAEPDVDMTLDESTQQFADELAPGKGSPDGRLNHVAIAPVVRSLFLDGLHGLDIPGPRKRGGAD